MELSNPINKDATSSPISKGSGLDSDGLPSLVDEDRQLKARISMLEKKLDDVVNLMTKSSTKKKQPKNKQRKSGDRTRMIYGDDFEDLDPAEADSDSEEEQVPELVADSDSESEESGEEKRKVRKRPKVINGRPRESIMYNRNKEDRDQLRDAHLRATSGSSIVVPREFKHEIIETTSFVKYKAIVRAIDEHEANPHNLPVFPYRFYSEKVRQKIVNSLKSYHSNQRNLMYDPTMSKIAPTDRELNLMLTSEFCVSFERMMRPSDKQHYEQIFRQVISTFKNQRVSDSIMSYNAFAVDVENLFLLAKDLVSVLGECDKDGKLLDYYPPMRPQKAYDLEGLIPLLTVSWPPAVLLEIRKKMGPKEQGARFLTDWMELAKTIVDSYRESNERWNKLMGAFSNSEKAKKRAQLSKFTEELNQPIFPGNISSDDDGDLYDQQMAHLGIDNSKVGLSDPDESESHPDTYSAFTRPLAMPVGIPTKKKEYSNPTAPKLTIKREETTDLNTLPCWAEVQGKGNCKRDNCPFSHNNTLLNNLAKSINAAMTERNKAVSFRSIEAGEVVEPPTIHYE